MSLDIQKTHKEVREAIDASVAGHAQSDVSGTLVSLRVSKYGNPKLVHAPMEMKHFDIVDEMILDVATDKGRATAQTFRTSFVKRKIKERRAFDRDRFPGKHDEADRLEALRVRRPELFI